MANKELNRLKVVLAEKKKTNKWLGEQLGKDKTTISKNSDAGAPSVSTMWRSRKLSFSAGYISTGIVLTNFIFSLIRS